MRVVDTSAWIEFLKGSRLGLALAGEFPTMFEALPGVRFHPKPPT